MSRHVQKIEEALMQSITVKKKVLDDINIVQSLSELADAIVSSLKAGGKVIFCGNGGSFADSQHLSAEFTSRFMIDRPSLPSLALGTNSSAMSAIANDYGYEQVFSRELSSIADHRDVFVGISTSGRSPNVLNALEMAVNLGLYSALLTGNNFTETSNVRVSNIITVPSGDTAAIQETHITIGHILCGLVESEFFDARSV